MSKIYDELKNAEQTQRGSHIHAGLRIHGEVTGSEDLLIDGAVDGPVNLSEGTLSIGASGSVKGNVAARDVVVQGAVTGNVDARNRIEIKASGSVTGDIVTSRIIIDDGAYCKGSIEIGRK